MKVATILTFTLLILSLLLSACGPSSVETIQPIKFEYTFRAHNAGELLAQAPALAPSALATCLLIA